ncbi:MAG: iron complex transport system substrate-binding protein [Gemmatimonadaceae bacterium]|nr:iron complex transport system substrate-binding protein [Gemmatimonadaceae bacterium]
MLLRHRPAAIALALAISACGDSRGPSLEATDDFGDPVRVGAPPTRIVSLNPATTEILFTLGAGSRLVGRTKYDSWPDSAKLVTPLGDGIQPNVEIVLAAHPDLVILYASQDNRPAAARFRAAGVNTLSLKVDHISDFRRTVRLLGSILRDSARAKIVIDSVYRTLDSVRAATAKLARPTVFWHIWDAPVITIGSGSFMNELVDIAGGKNVYADIAGPSAQVSLEDISRRNPDFILAGPIGRAQISSDSRWRIVRAARDNRIFVVDTLLVARPSVRLGEAAVSLANLLHPGTLR